MILFVLPDETSDIQLLKQARQGDKTAISQIYNRYAGSIYQFVRLRISPQQVAEDITSSVFEALIEGLAQGKGPNSSLRGWLFQVARHTIADNYRHEPPVALDNIDAAPTNHRQPELEVIKLLDVEKIRALIKTLSADQQEVLLLRYDRQLSLQETASIMGKNLNTIKTLQFRAVQQLGKQLQDEQIRVDR